jgi:hypothetical protein
MTEGDYLNRLKDGDKIRVRLIRWEALDWTPDQLAWLTAHLGQELEGQFLREPACYLFKPDNGSVLLSFNECRAIF